jgi:predicted nucleic acid-binding protein
VYLHKGILDPKIIDFLKIATDNGTFVSIMSAIELLGYKFPSKAELRKMEQMMNDTTIMQLDPTVTQQAILIRRRHTIRLPDAIIAATAIVHRFTLITRNVSDFKGIDNLLLINPFDL